MLESGPPVGLIKGKPPSVSDCLTLGRDKRRKRSLPKDRVLQFCHYKTGFLSIFSRIPAQEYSLLRSMLNVPQQSLVMFMTIIAPGHRPFGGRPPGLPSA